MKCFVGYKFQPYCYDENLKHWFTSVSPKYNH